MEEESPDELKVMVRASATMWSARGGFDPIRYRTVGGMSFALLPTYDRGGKSNNKPVEIR